MLVVDFLLLCRRDGPIAAVVRGGKDMENLVELNAAKMVHFGKAHLCTENGCLVVVGSCCVLLLLQMGAINGFCIVSNCSFVKTQILVCFASY